MCGIAGFAGFNDDSLLKAMCARLVHRGPDADGFYTAPDVGLSMRRLAIIDLKTGNQPLSNEARDVWVVFNGEIYNYQDLRRTLASDGHTLATTSDTETIPHLYEQHGLSFVEHLRGMFAIALWDEKRRRLVLVRDRIGEKPLFYCQIGHRLLFASEIKSLLQARVPRQVDPQAVCEYLALGYVNGPQTFYQGIRKLPPGHMLVWEDGAVSVTRYWERRKTAAVSCTAKQAETELAERLEDTVRLCLKSDVEVGAFLSGGIDSSVLVALMRRQSTQVQTFSVGYTGAAAGFNELRYAALVARQLGTIHHELILRAHSTMDLLPRILWHYDEPHGEPTSVLVYQLSEFTAQRVKVAIGGTGGDEIFFGYPRHAGIRLLEIYRYLPAVVRERVVERLVAMLPEATNGNRFAKRARRFVSGSHLPAPAAYLNWVTLLQPDVHAALISRTVADASSDPAGDAFLRDRLLGNGHRSLLDRAADVDVEGYLPEYQLAYVDRMSMAHSLEVRSPLCDYQLVEWVTGLPADLRLRGRRSKALLKDVAYQWLPRQIVDRKKVGFDSPVGQWFKEDLRAFLLTFLAPDQIARSGLLQPDAVQTLVGEHLAGARDHSLRLWSVVALEAWYRMYIEGGITDGRDVAIGDIRGASVLARATRGVRGGAHAVAASEGQLIS